MDDSRIDRIEETLRRVITTQEKIDDTLTQHIVLQEMIVSSLDKVSGNTYEIIQIATASMEDTKRIREKLFENGMSEAVHKIIESVSRVESRFDPLGDKIDKVGEQSSGMVVKLIVAIITGMIASAGVVISILQIFKI